MLSKLFSIDQIGFLDINLLDGALFMSLYTERLTNLLVLELWLTSKVNLVSTPYRRRKTGLGKQLPFLVKLVFYKRR